MNIKELRKRVRRGEIIIASFTKNIEDFESCINEGMVAVITKIDNSDSFGCAKTYFDLRPFDGHNEKFAQHNYYDKNGESCLSAKEAGMYPKSGIETVYFDENMDIVEFIILEEDVEN